MPVTVLVAMSSPSPDIYRHVGYKLSVGRTGELELDCIQKNKSNVRYTEHILQPLLIITEQVCHFTV